MDTVLKMPMNDSINLEAAYKLFRALSSMAVCGISQKNRIQKSSDESLQCRSALPHLAVHVQLIAAGRRQGNPVYSVIPTPHLCAMNPQFLVACSGQ